MQPNARRGGARGGGRSHWGGRGDSRNTPSRDEETSAFRDNRRRRNSQDDGQKARGGRSRSSQRQNGSQQAAPEVRAIHQKTPPPKTNSSQVRTRLDRDSAGWEQIWRERFEQLKKHRVKDRAEAIRNGTYADPDVPRKLSEAITLVGTCPDMCPEYERVMRVVQNDVWAQEADPASVGKPGTRFVPIEERMVKKFRRAAAGLEEQLPSDLRPPLVLQRTVNYLIDDVIGKAPSLANVHHFVWDRTRAIRNDFSIQQVSKVQDVRIAMDCYERIARFHIASMHELAYSDKPYDQYDWQQDREQLDKTLRSLSELYNDHAKIYRSPNEAEFRSYGVIFEIESPINDVEHKIQDLRTEIQQDPRVQHALKIYAAAGNITSNQGPMRPGTPHVVAQANYQRLWSLIRSSRTSYHLACITEIYFNLFRREILTSLWKCYRSDDGIDRDEFTLAELVDILGFDEVSQVTTFCEHYGFEIAENADGVPYLNLSSVKGRRFLKEKPGLRKQYRSLNNVEFKRRGRTLPALMHGLSVKDARTAGLIEEDNEYGRSSQVSRASREPKNDSLFVTGDSDEDGDERANGRANDDSRESPSATISLNPAATAFKPNLVTSGSSSTTTSSVVSVGGSSSFGKPSTLLGTSAPTTDAPKPNPFSAFAFPKTDVPKPTSFTQFSAAVENSRKPADGSPLTPSMDTRVNSNHFAKFVSPKDLPLDGSGNLNLFAKTPLDKNQTWSSEQPIEFAISSTTTTPAVPSSKSTVSPFPPTEAGVPKDGASTASVASFNQPALRSSTYTPNTTGPPTLEIFDRVAPPQPNTSSPVLVKQPTPSIPESISKPQLNPFGFAITSSVPNAASFEGATNKTSTFIHSAERPMLRSTSPFSLTPRTTPKPGVPSHSLSTAATPIAAAQQFPSVPGSTQAAEASSPFGGAGNISEPSISTSTAQLKAESPGSIFDTQNTLSFPSTSLSQAERPQPTVFSAKEAKKAEILSSLADKIFFDPTEGILRQFVENTVDKLIPQLVAQVVQERNNERADDFRSTSLALRYGRRWNLIMWHNLRARKARERRDRVRLEKKQAAAEAAVQVQARIDHEVEVFQDALRNSQTKVQHSNGVADLLPRFSDQPSQRMLRAKRPQLPSTASLSHFTPKTDHSPQMTQPESGEVNGKSHYRWYRIQPDATPSTGFEESVKARESTLLDPGWLSGDSAFGQSVNKQSNSSNRINTTDTNYFRLKAFKINANALKGHKRSRTIDDDGELSDTSARDKQTSPPGRKRVNTTDAELCINHNFAASGLLRKSSERKSPTQRPMYAPTRSSLGGKPTAEDLLARYAAYKEASKLSTSWMKTPSSAVRNSDHISPLSGSRKRGSPTDSDKHSKQRRRLSCAPSKDDPILAAAHELRQVFDESEHMYREMAEELAKRDSLSQSGSPPNHGLHQSQGSPPRSLPAFYGRKSMFVPKEAYGKGPYRRNKQWTDRPNMSKDQEFMLDDASASDGEKVGSRNKGKEVDKNLHPIYNGSGIGQWGVQPSVSQRSFSALLPTDMRFRSDTSMQASIGNLKSGKSLEEAIEL